MPATILNSLDKNNKIFPTADAVAPRLINTNENPKENKIVFIKQFFYLDQFRSNFYLLYKKYNQV